MLVFIDDSGDPDFSLSKGSTPVFVIASIIFDDELEAEKTAVAIKQLKRELGFKDTTEFKFSGSSREVRESFLKVISPFNFRVRCIVVKKENIISSQLRSDKQSFYSYFIKSVLKHNKGTIKSAKVKIDGSGNRTFRKQFLSYLKRELNSPQNKTIESIKLVDSKNNALIQLADMVAGTIRRHCAHTKGDADIYWNYIKSKIEDEWNFK